MAQLLALVHRIVGQAEHFGRIEAAIDPDQANAGALVVDADVSAQREIATGHRLQALFDLINQARNTSVRDFRGMVAPGGDKKKKFKKKSAA